MNNENIQHTINATEGERQLSIVGNNFKETDEVAKENDNVFTELNKLLSEPLVVEFEENKREYIFRSFEVEMMEEYGEYGIMLNELIKFYQKEDSIKSENDENLFLNNLANLLTNSKVTFKHKLEIVEKLTFVRQCFMS